MKNFTLKLGIAALLIISGNSFAQEIDLNNLPFPTGGNDWEIAYSDNWKPLQDRKIPEWMIDAKFGVYTHCVAEW